MDSTFVVIDLETTGFDVKHAEVIDIGAVRVEGGIITDTFSSLIDPGFFIPERIKELTGITNAMVVGSPKMRDVLPEFMEFVGDGIVVGHHVTQDIKFIDKYTRLYMKERFKRPYICTLELSRKLLTSLPKHSLKDVADYFGIDYSRLHRALDDAVITAHVFMELLNLLWSNYGIGDYFSIKKLAKTGRF
ncbi:3'-5' exonuclease [Hydrogenivirga caldilitoris]|uniref:3'-5' exonuclease n=1 Tax=Hydrogenivirga caldilitoris TaxID=246264 RepID=UPI001FE4F895|nr:3'-5' exonuclease [Hydrogenivirga caldilitoris]